MQLNRILIGMVVLGLISTGLVIFISGAVDTYGVSDYDNSSLESFNQMTELSNQVEDFNEDSGKVDSDSNDDKLGSLFTSTYQSASVIKRSVNILTNMISEGIGNVTILGGFGQPLKVGLSMIVLIAIFIGIFMHFITKSERN